MGRRDNDIKAPDGYLLGGLRKVRADGTILFQRGWWKAPDEMIGETVWLHTLEPDEFDHIEIARGGLHIYEARAQGETVKAPRTERQDARPGYRDPTRKAWAAKMAVPALVNGEGEE